MAEPQVDTSTTPKKTSTIPEEATFSGILTEGKHRKGKTKNGDAFEFFPFRLRCGFSGGASITLPGPDQPALQKAIDKLESAVVVISDYRAGEYSVSFVAKEVRLADGTVIRAAEDNV